MTGLNPAATEKRTETLSLDSGLTILGNIRWTQETLIEPFDSCKRPGCHYMFVAVLLAAGSFVNARIPPEFAGRGELVSVK